MKKYLYLLVLLLFFPLQVLGNDNVNIYVFHRYDCRHCQDALEYLHSLEGSRDDITIFEYEIIKETNAYNRVLLEKAEGTLGITVTSVPFIIIGNNHYIGFSNSDKETFVKAIDFYKNNEYRDSVGIALGITEENGKENLKYEEKEFIVDVPLLGSINVKNLSLPLISILMGLTDGFNPCAMWILLFLITMLFNMKDKKKMWILGLTFIGTSAFIYFLFMMAWIQVTDFINSIKTLQVVIGLFAIIFGIINICRYFKEINNDGCMVIKKEKRRFIFDKIKKIVESKYFIIAIIGIIGLAVIVNLIELLCSLGLPVMFTEILSLNNLNTNTYLSYIILYIIFFMLDDVLVFTLSMLTLQSKAISTKYNKYSHLFGGMIMLLIGLLIIFKPEWLAFTFK